MSLLHLITQKPHLLLAHVDAYSELVSEELTLAFQTWANVAAIAFVAILLLCGASVLAGVGFMLWVVMPPMQAHSLWLLFLTPVVPVLLSLICVHKLKRKLKVRVFSNLKSQVSEDVALLRELTKAK